MAMAKNRFDIETLFGGSLPEEEEGMGEAGMDMAAEDGMGEYDEALAPPDGGEGYGESATDFAHMPEDGLESEPEPESLPLPAISPTSTILSGPGAGGGLRGVFENNPLEEVAPPPSMPPPMQAPAPAPPPDLDPLTRRLRMGR